MNKKYYFLIAGLLSIVLLGACGKVAYPPTYPNIRTLSVNGQGQVTLVPDIAYINIGVRTEAKDVSTALSGNTELAAAISAELKSLGVAEKDIQTTAFNVYPMQQYDKDGQISGTTYVVENTVNITVRDLAKLGKLLDATVKAGANNIYGISFDVEDKSAAIEQARELAIQDAREKAEAIAAASGVKLGDLQNVSVYNSSGVTPYYDAKMGIGGAESQAAVPVAAGTLIITADASMSYEIK
jgi:uncharacterized protein YggE